MKVTSDKTPFVPVTIILESQHEVDAIFALLDHFIVSSTVGLPNEWEKLDEYKSSEYKSIFDRLNSAISK